LKKPVGSNLQNSIKNSGVKSLRAVARIPLREFGASRSRF